MTKLTVELYATLRELTGQKKLELDFTPGEKVEDVLKRLVEKFPDLKEVLFKEGKVNPGIRIYSQERTLKPDDKLREGETLKVFPPLAGG